MSRQVQQFIEDITLLKENSLSYQESLELQLNWHSNLILACTCNENKGDVRSPFTKIDSACTCNEIKSIVNFLIEALDDERASSIHLISKCFEKIGKPAVQPLIDALHKGKHNLTKNIPKILSLITRKKFIFGSKNPQKWQIWWNVNK